MILPALAILEMVISRLVADLVMVISNENLPGRPAQTVYSHLIWQAQWVNGTH